MAHGGLRRGRSPTWPVHRVMMRRAGLEALFDLRKEPMWSPTSVMTADWGTRAGLVQAMSTCSLGRAIALNFGIPLVVLGFGRLCSDLLPLENSVLSRPKSKSG